MFPHPQSTWLTQIREAMDAYARATASSVANTGSASTTTTTTTANSTSMTRGESFREHQDNSCSGANSNNNNISINHNQIMSTSANGDLGLTGQLDGQVFSSPQDQSSQAPPLPPPRRSGALLTFTSPPRSLQYGRSNSMRAAPTKSRSMDAVFI